MTKNSLEPDVVPTTSKRCQNDRRRRSDEQTTTLSRYDHRSDSRKCDTRSDLPYSHSRQQHSCSSSSLHHSATGADLRLHQNVYTAIDDGCRDGNLSSRATRRSCIYGVTTHTSNNKSHGLVSGHSRLVFGSVSVINSRLTLSSEFVNVQNNQSLGISWEVSHNRLDETNSGRINSREGPRRADEKAQRRQGLDGSDPETVKEIVLALRDIGDNLNAKMRHNNGVGFSSVASEDSFCLS